jgi:hypothetical protein
VSLLYSYRDLYFAAHPVSEAEKKSERVKQKLKECNILIQGTIEKGKSRLYLFVLPFDLITFC